MTNWPWLSAKQVDAKSGISSGLPGTGNDGNTFDGADVGDDVDLPGNTFDGTDVGNDVDLPGNTFDGGDDPGG